MAHDHPHSERRCRIVTALFVEMVRTPISAPTRDCVSTSTPPNADSAEALRLLASWTSTVVLGE